MKKIYFVFVAFFTIFISNAQIINFPDANFKAKLLSASTSNSIAKNAAGTSIKIDANNNGQIEQSEALLVHKLFYSSGVGPPLRMSTTAITDLTGIAFFTNLRYLNASGNQLSSINLNSNTLLEELYLNNNLFSSLSFTGLVNLKTLSVGYNNLTTLNTSNLPLLNNLVCRNNPFVSLNLSANTQLKSLNCQYNQFTTLNVNSNTLLILLDCTGNALTNINLQNNTELKYLYCTYNQFTSLNLNANMLLQVLHCSNNSISSISLNAPNTLKSFDCSTNLFSTLNLTNYNALQYLGCGNNPISSLIFGNNPILESVSCPNTNITALDFSQTGVSELRCNDNPNLTFINLKNNIISPDLLYLPPPASLQYDNFNLYNLPSLTQICCDTAEISAIQYGTQTLNNLLIGDFCSGKSIAILKLNIQGYYDSSIQKMRPFKSTTTSTTITNNADDITVELRNTSGALIASTITALKTSGNAVCLFNNQPIGSYYVVVKHRNSIETWSANPVTIGSTPLTYNFTNAASKAYGSNMIQVESGIFAIYSGDLNQDQVIDNSDATNLFNDIENSAYGYLTTDLNGDGAVDNSDTVLFFNNTENSIFSIHP